MNKLLSWLLVFSHYLDILCSPHRDGDDVLGVQIHLHEFDHPYLAVLVGAEIEPHGLEIIDAGPNRMVG